MRLLPREHRDRYRRELAAELHDLSNGARLPYALRILRSALALRSALRSIPAAPVPESVQQRPLRCRLGRHDWELLHNDDGEEYLECVRCGAQKDPIHLGDFGNPGGAWY